MYEAQTSQQWVEGFVKAANDSGITDPEQISALMAKANRLNLADKHAEEFEAGFCAAAEEAGLDKDAIAPLLIAGGVGLGAGLLNRFRNSSNRWNTLSPEDAAAASKQHRGSNIISRGWNRLTNPALMRGVKQHQTRSDRAVEREDDPHAYNAFKDKQQQEAQNKAKAWGGGSSGSGAPGRWRPNPYRNYYRNP